MAEEWLQEKILALSPRALEELAAALLRAMDYHTRVSPIGSDRGVDVLAARDPLTLLDPRIKIQVKHRPNRRMSAPEVRELLSVLRVGEIGLCVSTGGFSREAYYEAERSNNITRLLDLYELCSLILKFYDRFDEPGKKILPLQKVYWPVE
jgi:restriction system protein